MRRGRKDPKYWFASRAVASAIPTCICRMAISCWAATRNSMFAPDAPCPLRWARDRRHGRSRTVPMRQQSQAPKLRSTLGLAAGNARHARSVTRIFAQLPYLGITVDGGFATHVLVPHERYLIDYEPLSPGFAGALMCSGLTAYAALKRLADRVPRARRPAGRPWWRRLDGPCPRARHVWRRAVCCRRRRQKTRGRLAAGASAAFDPSDPNARKALLKASGGIYAACDFAGSEGIFEFCHRRAR